MAVVRLTLAVTTLDVTQLSFDFLTFLTDAGFPFFYGERVEEELMTPGVGGSRYRWVHDQAPSFEVKTVTDAQTYSSAVTLAQQQRTAKGRWGTLAGTVGTDTVFNYSVHVEACDARAIPGPVSGGGAASGAQASVNSVWKLKRIL